MSSTKHVETLFALRRLLLWVSVNMEVRWRHKSRHFGTKIFFSLATDTSRCPLRNMSNTFCSTTPYQTTQLAITAKNRLRIFNFRYHAINRKSEKMNSVPFCRHWVALSNDLHEPAADAIFWRPWLVKQFQHIINNTKVQMAAIFKLRKKIKNLWRISVDTLLDYIILKFQLL